MELFDIFSTCLYICINYFIYLFNHFIYLFNHLIYLWIIAYIHLSICYKLFFNRLTPNHFLTVFKHYTNSRSTAPAAVTCNTRRKLHKALATMPKPLVTLMGRCFCDHTITLLLHKSHACYTRALLLYQDLGPGHRVQAPWHQAGPCCAQKVQHHAHKLLINHSNEALCSKGRPCIVARVLCGNKVLV